MDDYLNDEDLKEFDESHYKELVSPHETVQCRYCEAHLRPMTRYHYCGSSKNGDSRRDILIMPNGLNLVIYENLTTGNKYYYKQICPEEINE
jgi:hypothetical protein